MDERLEYASSGRQETFARAKHVILHDTTPPRATCGPRLIVSESKRYELRQHRVNTVESDSKPDTGTGYCEAHVLDFDLECSEELYDAICEQSRTEPLTAREFILKRVFERERASKLREGVLMQRVADLEQKLAELSAVTIGAKAGTVIHEQENQLPGRHTSSVVRSKKEHQERPSPLRQIRSNA
jgi:hypothetical protein